MVNLLMVYTVDTSYGHLLMVYTVDTGYGQPVDGA
jgi:hypothetical protein